MRLKDWKQRFAPHILRRGEDYCEVEPEIEEGAVTDLYCSCPYAEQGGNCKHTAAAESVRSALRFG